jgi:lipopolysaccharide/colanic/teichoic acid biosynthesis glycosyltransferase
MHRVVLLVLDLILIALATIFALFLRDNLEISAARFAPFLPYLVVTMIAAVPVLLAFGLNRTVWRLSSLPDYVRIAFAVVVTVLLAVALGFVVNRMEGVARSLPILQGLLMLCLLVSVRVLMRLRHARRDRSMRALPSVSQAQELILVVGLNAVTELFLQSVDEFANEGVKVAGLLGRGDRHRGRLIRLYPVLGTAEDLERVLADLEVHGQLIDRIVITTRFEDLSPAAQAALLQVERTSTIQLDFFAERVVLNKEPARDPGRLEGRNGKPPAELSRLDLNALASNPYFRWKRMLDVTAAGVAIVCLAPFAVLLGVLIMCVAGPPPIFWQQRPGERGRPFRLYKFRTMRSAHDRYGRRLADAERLSRIGWLVRRVRLDELPQLYNILVGEMSFVGPRPLLPADQSPAFAARLAVRPGLTGWAQIKGGRELTASDKAALDIWYVRNASFRLDLRILVGTLRMIVLGERMDREAIRQAWRELGDDRPEQQRLVPREEETSLLPEGSRGDYQSVLRVTVPQVPPARAHPSAGSRA